MGIIVTDVKTIYLPQYPEQESMIKPFLSGFDVTYAEKKTINNKNKIHKAKLIINNARHNFLLFIYYLLLE